MKFYKSNISFIFIFVMVLSISSIAQEDAQIEGDEMSLENRKDLESLKDILTMQKLLEITRSDGFQTSVVNSKREEQFIDARDQQKFLLDQAKLRLQEEEERSIRLQSEFENNEKILEEIGETLRIRIGNFGELFGVFRQVAGEVIATVKNSIVSLQFPNREIALAVMAETKGLPSISQMKSLVVSMLEEMTQSGRVERFQGEVVLPGGSLANAEIVRVGVFNAITENFFLKFVPETQTLQVLARQPARRYRSMADDLFKANKGFVTMAVDPSRGQILGLLIQAPGLSERINQGGVVGYFIILIGFIGVVLSLWRLRILRKEGEAIERQLSNTDISSDNALGRILSVYTENEAATVESLELKVDEAILREVPKLEKYHSIIKVFAAVAPLLGLLGTVVGMIATFQALTLFGTGDPKLMAGGISQALVTTMLGLIVAIPLVFLHSILTSWSGSLIEILEEQSAGLIARNAIKK
ncbi:MAG: MotA/TolQ/ExbB proton channel family protein [Gammaproteobacteria bacterium]|jgi:biopolymer transport protein ExbB|nr:MotA/TolQ/ExbB proton channel family protein [Gammaproteobacteria bacterium]MBT5216116.1 MotA/TolQ/ExbB proton channel family protein [Gammaproteobacteria bacterium]MBT5542732.1 MotA/TolQ/ExbB proton channel family protein [Gammaproteobacteria bacterium]MBT6073653.1 MotA/TolQ/ExbB proton channel family protein [Gammaproteobacteria bacterium]MBT7753675.1 MotA/TolQ/ExbB proton channel family protein [Gammaproteobacteria bacterium]